VCAGAWILDRGLQPQNPLSARNYLFRRELAAGGRVYSHGREAAMAVKTISAPPMASRGFHWAFQCQPKR
jgi:hypothetical protein